MLVQRRRRWANIKPALVQGVVLAGHASQRKIFLEVPLIFNGPPRGEQRAAWET